MISIDRPTRPSKKVLIVDDEHAVLALVSEVLELNGHDVTPASSGHEAVACVEKNAYDVFLLDLDMPNMSGFDLAILIRLEKRFEQSVLVAHSGGDGLDRFEQAQTSGFDYFLPKPSDLAVISEVVHAPRQSKLLILSYQIEKTRALLKNSRAISARSQKLRLESAKALARSSDLREKNN